jgi:hypothetical protein
LNARQRVELSGTFRELANLSAIVLVTIALVLIREE